MLGLIEQAFEAALVARLDLQHLAELLDGGVEVGHLGGIDLQRVGRVVAGQHDAVAVFDQPRLGTMGTTAMRLDSARSAKLSCCTTWSQTRRATK